MNKVILIGNLGQDPDQRAMKDGTAVTTISMATTKRGKDKEYTEWHRVVFFGKVAEIAGQYLAKGNKAAIEGELRTRDWTDKEGVERKTTEIVANQLEFLTPKGEQQAKPKAKETPKQDNDFGDFDEDIPF